MTSWKIRVIQVTYLSAVAGASWPLMVYGKKCYAVGTSMLRDAFPLLQRCSFLMFLCNHALAPPSQIIAPCTFLCWLVSTTHVITKLNTLNWCLSKVAQFGNCSLPSSTYKAIFFLLVHMRVDSIFAFDGHLYNLIDQKLTIIWSH